MVEPVNRSIGFRSRRAMFFNRPEQVGSSPVMKKKQSLAYAPQGRGTELIGASGTLGDPIGKSCAHVMQSEIGEGVIGDVAHSGIQ